MVSQLKVTVEGAVVAYTGKFALEQEYRVAVEPGLSSDGPLKLESGKIEMVSFEPVPPRLYFEAFGTHQLSSGLRKFHLLAVNVPDELGRFDERAGAPERQPGVGSPALELGPHRPVQKDRTALAQP